MVGCGDHGGPHRAVVSGTITYNGKPISEGMIRFIPDDKSPVPAAGAGVIDGKYRADAHGGVPVGTFRVQIEAFRPLAKANLAKASAPKRFAMEEARYQYLPKKHNVDTQVEMTIQPRDREITRNFDLTD
jgi:hypothetical protein